MTIGSTVQVLPGKEHYLSEKELCKSSLPHVESGSEVARLLDRAFLLFLELLSWYHTAPITVMVPHAYKRCGTT